MTLRMYEAHFQKKDGGARYVNKVIQNSTTLRMYEALIKVDQIGRMLDKVVHSPNCWDLMDQLWSVPVRV